MADAAQGGAGGAALPSGTVTFLFTDIEGSTHLWESYPDAMQAALAQHDALMRAAIESHAGRVFKVVGDAFCAAFATAGDALAAAIAAQRALGQSGPSEAGAADQNPATPRLPVPLLVRMGLHTGPAEARQDDYQGYLTLAQAQRVMSAAHGGQVLSSNATAALLSRQLPDGVSLRDLGLQQ